MPTTIVYSFLVELALVALTGFLLVQPRFAFRPDANRWKGIARWSGLFLLCVTFCWSVVFGIVLSVNGIRLF